MCLILDANFVHHVHPSADADGAPIRTALILGKARLVYGGKLGQEYRDGPGEFRRWLVRLDQAGRARRVSDTDVDKVTMELTEAGLCVSDDAHIIALARVSNVRLLCSTDGDLHTDFTNNEILAPRGRVYQRQQHAHLIDAHCAKQGSAQPSGRKRRRTRKAPAMKRLFD